MRIIYGLITEVIADEGMLLTNDDINYANHLYLGKGDSPSNWHEVPIEEVPHNEQLFTEGNISYPI